ncbi:MAG TPA: hypothetical protein DCW68_02565 [Rhodospirillaceae bacterium]|nr:MAG: hypothetical protein A2018_05540 [Alphaproteobacteria bacterium GWF2_58_20]HAU28977.1 hypothetical protein [Rhodospirillaceae bacterium]
MLARRIMKCAGRRGGDTLADVLAKGGSGEFYAGTAPGFAPWVKTALPWGSTYEPVFFPQDGVFVLAGDAPAGSSFRITQNLVDYDYKLGRWVHSPTVPSWVYLSGCLFVLIGGTLYRLSGENWETEEVVWSQSLLPGGYLTLGSAGNALYIIGDRNTEDIDDQVLVRSTDLGKTWSSITPPQGAVLFTSIAVRGQYRGRLRENGGKAYSLVDAFWPKDGGGYSNGLRLWGGGASWADLTPSGWAVDGNGLLPSVICPHAGVVVALIMAEMTDGAAAITPPRFAVRGAGGAWSTVLLGLEGVLGELPAGTFWVPDAPVWPDWWTGTDTGHPFRIEPVGDAIHCTARFRGWDGSDYTADVGYAHGWSEDGATWTWEAFTPDENDQAWHFWAGRYDAS